MIKKGSTKPAPKPVQKKVNKLPTRKPEELTGSSSWVIYGRSGSGKTTFAGSFPKPILFLDCKDEGTDSLLGLEEVEVMDITDTDDLEMVYEYLVNNPEAYKTVVLDTVSNLQQIVVEEISQKKAKVSKKPAGSFGSLTRQDWGAVSEYMKMWLVNYRDLSKEHGIEIVFIAQDRAFNLEDADSEDGAVTPEVGPRLSPSIASTLNAAVSIIANTFIRVRTIKTKDPKTGKRSSKQKMEYALRLGANPIYVTKARKSKDIELPDYVDDPDYESVMDAIKDK